MLNTSPASTGRNQRVVCIMGEGIDQAIVKTNSAGLLMEKSD
jgi:hypothetical protein